MGVSAENLREALTKLFLKPIVLSRHGTNGHSDVYGLWILVNDTGKIRPFYVRILGKYRYPVCFYLPFDCSVLLPNEP